MTLARVTCALACMAVPACIATPPAPVTLVSGLHHPDAIVTDGVSAFVTDDDQLLQVDLRTGEARNLAGGVSGLSIDPDLRTLYTERSHGIVAVDRDTGALRPIADDTDGTPIVADAGHVYWATVPDTGDSVVHAVAKTGGAPFTLFTSPTPIGGLVADDGGVFVLAGDAIRRVDVASQQVTDVATGLGTGRALASDGTHLFAVVDRYTLPPGASGPFDLWRVEKTGAMRRLGGFESDAGGIRALIASGGAAYALVGDEVVAGDVDRDVHELATIVQPQGIAAMPDKLLVTMLRAGSLPPAGEIDALAP